MGREVPRGYTQLLPIWNRLAKRLQLIYIGLGVIATVTSLVVATFTHELTEEGVKLVSFVAAVSLGLLTAFDVGGKANAARNAWRTLNSAILQFAEDQTFTVQQLHKEYMAGERLLGDIKYRPPGERPSVPDPDNGTHA